MNNVCPLRSMLAFRELRLLDLHDEIGRREDVLAALRDGRARRLIVRVLESDTRPGAALHEHLVSGVDELANARGHQSHPILVNLDLFGDADFHGCCSAFEWGSARLRARAAGKLQKLAAMGRKSAESAVEWSHRARNCTEPQEAATMKLDRYDRAIVHVLQLDGRITNSQLAERVSLSESACLRRVRALEESGFIEGYTALINQQKAGCPGERLRQHHA